MRFIPTRVHGVLDYLVGIVLIAWPLIARYPMDSAEALVPLVLGIGAIGYSLFTDYELSIVRSIPMPVHLGLDMGSGILLAASPWLFGFADQTWAPYVIIGLFEIGASICTRTVPDTGRATVRR
jgi:hypothetical protein